MAVRAPNAKCALLRYNQRWVNETLLIHLGPLLQLAYVSANSEPQKQDKILKVFNSPFCDLWSDWKPNSNFITAVVLGVEYLGKEDLLRSAYCCQPPYRGSESPCGNYQYKWICPSCSGLIGSLESIVATDIIGRTAEFGWEPSC